MLTAWWHVVADVYLWKLLSLTASVDAEQGNAEQDECNEQECVETRWQELEHWLPRCLFVVYVELRYHFPLPTVNERNGGNQI